jgi:Tfp pilus assembly protein PilF
MRGKRWEAARTALEEARVVADATGQRAYESEHRRIQAEVATKLDDRVAAERSYRESLTIAREQGARWLELRAARGYATFLLESGRPAEARELLAPVVAWFTEGRETLDYVYSEALLRTLE